MNTDNVKQLCEEALRRLATALEQGHSDAVKIYLATMARFHQYSWGNVPLIFTQKPNALDVAGLLSRFMSVKSPGDSKYRFGCSATMVFGKLNVIVAAVTQRLICIQQLANTNLFCTVSRILPVNSTRELLRYARRSGLYSEAAMLR